LQNLKKTKGSKWAKIFTISMPKRPPVAARTSSQSMQLIVLHVQHSALDSSEIEAYCDLLWLVEIFTSKYQYGLAKEALRSSIYVKFGVPRAHLVWEEIQGMVQLIPKEVDEGKPHLSTKQIYIYISIYFRVKAWGSRKHIMLICSSRSKKKLRPVLLQHLLCRKLHKSTPESEGLSSIEYIWIYLHIES
jgi:hypothetical protein